MSKRESVSEYIFSPFEMYDKPEWLPQKTDQRDQYNCQVILMNSQWLTIPIEINHSNGL